MEKPRFNSVSEFYRKLFGCKAYKIAIDAGCTCPTRDGTKGTGGCTFCSQSGSGDFAASRLLSVTEQIEQGKSLVGSKCRNGTFIAYFQNFTNTYGDPDVLEAKYLEAAGAENVSGISIATRPDCLSNDILERIGRISRNTFVQVELGLQTSCEKTAESFRRGFGNNVYLDAIERIRKCSPSVHVVTHMILGLPGETPEDMVRTARFCSYAGTDGMKLSLLHVLRGTDIYWDYMKGSFRCMEKEEYFAVLSDVLENLNPDIVIHRLTGDGPKKLLEAPLWTGDKHRVWNDMQKWFSLHDVIQGRHYPLNSVSLQ